MRENIAVSALELENHIMGLNLGSFLPALEFWVSYEMPLSACFFIL